MEKEIWKDIPGYEGLYQVSTLGQVKSLGRIIFEKPNGRHNGRWHKFPEKLLKIGLDRNGYAAVNLYNLDKLRKRCNVHRLVALTFLENPNKLSDVNHKDENKQNNNVNNLEWCTTKYNLCYGNRMNKYRISRGTRVARYDLDGNYIDSWESMSHAAVQVYGNANKETDILRNCKNKVTRVLNYKWKFTNEISSTH